MEDKTSIGQAMSGRRRGTIAMEGTEKNDATNFCKHLLFRAVLEEFREGAFNDRVFPLPRLAIGILTAA